ncbi:MAG TPA: hypothetical protein VNR64_07475 [Vicinamibacterales bacterium]|nr:hypothetical protein [Vicinamibacterales bacterium]
MCDFDAEHIFRIGQARLAVLRPLVEPVWADDDENRVRCGDVLENLRQVIGADGEVVDVLPYAGVAVTEGEVVAKAPGPSARIVAAIR